MNYETFETLLKSASLSKKDFAELVKMNYTSVTNWKQGDSVPDWVDSWIENYKKANKFDTATKLFTDFNKIMKD